MHPKRSTIMKQVMNSSQISLYRQGGGMPLLSGNRKSAEQLISYKSHGRIENFTRNQNLIHVTAHEGGHLNHNRLTALAKGESISQEVNYNIRITRKGVVAEGVTRVTARTKPETTNAQQEQRKNFQGGYDDILRNSMNSAVVQIATELSRLRGKLFSSGSGNIQETKNRQQYPSLSSSPENLSEPSSDKTDNSPGVKKEKTTIDQLLLRIKDLEESLKKERSRVEETQKLSEGYTREGKLSSVSQTEHPIKEEEHIDLTRQEELALQSHTFNQLGEPPLQANSFGDSFRFADTINAIGQYSSATVLSAQQDNNSRNLQAKSGFLDSLRQDLTDLKQKTTALASLNNYITTQATTYNRNRIEVTPSINSQAGNYQVSVSSLARSFELRSNTFDSSTRALNLEGSFSVNGTVIDVVKTDSLSSIMQKINLGEDLNGNGVIDRSQDLNGNGTLDSYIVSGGASQGSVYIQEDNIGKGFAGYEDTNGNNLLDGGTKEHGVLATITSNQLILKYKNNTEAKGIVLSEDIPSLSRITLADTGSSSATLASSSAGLLTFLGFTVSIEGTHQSSSYAYDFRNKTERSDANFTVNGTAYTRTTNTITDVIPDATLKLKETTPGSADPVQIHSSVKKAVTLVKDFVGSFNKVMEKMNDAILATPDNSGIMRNNPKLHRIHKAVTESVLGGAFPDNNLIEQLTGLGITPNKGSNGINILAAQNIADTLQRTSPSKEVNYVVNNPSGKNISTGSGSTFSALKAPAVGKVSDFTLSFDETTFIQKLSTDPQKVFNLFNAEGNGIAPLLTKTLNTTLDEKNGTIANEQAVIALKQNNSSKIPDALKKTDVKQFQHLQKAFAQTISSQLQGKNLLASLQAL